VQVFDRPALTKKGGGQKEYDQKEERYGDKCNRSSNLAQARLLASDRMGF
jgi:hypothetical protein